MENCLVRRLKASVSNPDLPLFDAIKITISASVASNAQLRMGALYENDVHLSIPSGVTLTNGETVLTGKCYLPKDTSAATSWDKYTVANTSGSEKTILLKGVSRLKVFGATAPNTGINLGKIDISTVFNTSLVAMLVEGYSQVYGNFEQFGRAVNIKYVHIGATSITGDLLKFISNAIKAGKTTGSVNINTIDSTAATVGTDDIVELNGNQTWEPSGNNYRVTYVTSSGSNTCIMDIDGNLIS